MIHTTTHKKLSTKGSAFFEQMQKKKEERSKKLKAEYKRTKLSSK